VFFELWLQMMAERVAEHVASKKYALWANPVMTFAMRPVEVSSWQLALRLKMVAVAWRLVKSRIWSLPLGTSIA
jgi:hypothetical protein